MTRAEPDEDLARALAAWLAGRRRARMATVVAACGVIGALALVPLWSGGSFNLGRFGGALAYGMAAIGLNLAFGYAGELVLGHSVIMAAGGYVAGMLGAHLGWSFPAALLAGTATGALVGLVIMLPGLRVQGWYLALITMFAVLVLPHVVILSETWTGGEFGLTGIRAAAVLGYPLPKWLLFETTLAAAVLMWLLSSNFVRSGWGHRLRTLRDARRAADSVGIDLANVRLVVYFLCAVPAALAGVFLAYTEQFVNADSFGMSLTLLLLTGVVLGGGGTAWGPLVGMAPLVALTFWVGPFSQYNALALGGGLMVGALVFTDGLVPAIGPRLPRLVRAFQREATPRSAESTRDGGRVAVVERARPEAAGRGGVIVSARGIVKRFGGVVALDGAELVLERGALLGLVGPNGSGKSTFLNVLCGFVAPDAGRVEIAGSDVTGWPTHRIARTGVGRTFQVPQLVEECTALENIEIGLLGVEPESVLRAIVRSPGIVRGERGRRTRALATFAALGLPRSAIGSPVSAISLGLKRIVEVGRAVVSAPALLLLDEPAAGLNDDERSQLGGVLRRLQETGMTILVVEHNVSFVMQFCDEVMLLESGAVTCRGKLSERLPEALVAYLNYVPGHSGDRG